MTQYSCSLKLLVCGHIMIGGLLFYSVFILGIVYWQETLYQLLRLTVFLLSGLLSLEVQYHLHHISGTVDKLESHKAVLEV